VSAERNLVVCLMGPTASGKTDVAIRLSDTFAVDLVSVDSALVYRGMDIGTAKPDAETRRRYPHALIDIRDPEQAYSAGDFVRDATEAISQCHEKGRIPLLVGGTMMYFRSLIHGLAALPEADDEIRSSLDDEAACRGWAALHEQLAVIDPQAAARINENDSQRIQRALEVYRASGRTLTEWQSGTRAPSGYDFARFALIPEPRPALHARIERRLDLMFASGFVGEVSRLRARAGLGAEQASMRAVGYRQVWRHLEGEYDLREARSRALAATRQLAKRQLTWLRREPGLVALNPLEVDACAAISTDLRARLEGRKN
jgi:tRNA dimethylallyltransferase